MRKKAGAGGERQPFPGSFRPFLENWKMHAGILCALAVAGGLSAAENKETPAKPQESDPARLEIEAPKVRSSPIQMDVNMVLVPVTVTDPYDRIVTGLERTHFEIFDEKVPQNIAAFSTEDTPISVGLVFDSSGSMGGKIQKSKEASLQFFKTSNPQDEFFLIHFANRPNFVSRFTSTYEDILERLLFVKSEGRTALLDAIYLGLNEMKKASTTRKALLIMSDGGDNHSRYTERDVKRAVKESDVQIYAVGIFEPVTSRVRTPEEAGGPALLSGLSDLSGGRMFTVDDARELPDIVEKISIELRNQYLIGYRPTNLIRDGRWRRIRVKLRPPPGLPLLQVYARSGYYAPTQ